MSEHSVIGPSAAHRWMNCRGSVVLSKGITEPPSMYAAEGNAAHMLAAWSLNENQVASNRLGDTLVVTGPANTEFSFDVDEDMAEAVEDYVSTLVLNYGWNEPSNLRAVEQRLPFGKALGIPNEYGTADVIIIRGTELQVHDLKYGKGHRVDAQDNPQLMLYALGALEEYGDFFDILTVRTVIHQPRLHHVDEAVYSVEFLQGGFRVAAATAAKHALALYKSGTWTRDDLRPDGDTCRWCRAKAKCPALNGRVMELVGADVAANDFSPIDIPPPEADDVSTLARKYAGLALVRAWADAVESEVRSSLDRGLEVPGYKLVAGKRGQRQWSNNRQVEEMLKTSMRLTTEEMYSRKLISVKQAELLLADQPKRWARLADLVTQPEGKPCVVSASDKRPAINPMAFS